MKTPMQPLYKDPNGVVRFKENPIVKHLLDKSTELGFGLNELAETKFSDSDWQQFSQLVGISASDFCDLSHVDYELYTEVHDRAQELIND